MTKYFKIIEGEYIGSVGTVENGNYAMGNEITEEEYNCIMAAIKSMPEDTPTHYYAIKADTLEYVLIERPEPIPIPEPKYTLDEAAQTLAEEAGLDGYDV